MTETMDVKRAGHRVHLGQDTLLLHLRAVACGIDEAELRALGRQARNRTSWSEGLAALAGRCRESAVAAQSGGRPGDAGPLWRRAAACYHFASLFLEGGAQRACRDECRRAYACFSSLIDPPCRRVEIPFGGGVLPAYVRDAGGDGGWVVMVGALDMCKEVEGHRFAEAFVERGLSVLAFDGPGQGELADATTMRADYETVVGAVLDFIGDDRVGVFGASLGGYLAVRAAAMDPRIAACISFCGPCDLRPVLGMAPWIQRKTAAMFGFAGIEPLVDPGGPFRLAALPRALACPTLAVHATEDHYVPVEHVELLQAWAEPGSVGIWPCESAEHCCFSLLDAVLPQLADWMADQTGR